MNTPQSLHTYDFIIVLAYFAIVIWVGVYFKKFVKQAKDYFAAGSGVPWWLAGISQWMGSHSATMFVIYSQIAFKYGFVAMTICWAVVPAMILAATFFAHRWRRTRVMTPLGFMEQRYSKTIQQVFVWTGLPIRVLDNALRILATTIFIAAVVNQGWLSLQLGILILGLLMLTYSMLGGQMAVLITDFFQAVVLSIAVVMLLPLSLKVVGGFSGLVAAAKTTPGVPDTFFKLIAPPYDLFYWIMFSLVILLNYNASWGLVQKYNCVATEKDSRKVAVTMGVLSFISPPIFFIPAMVARVYLPKIMGSGVLARSDEVYALIALKVLPVGVMGLLVAAMFSATLSTIGNEFNVLSGILTKDFYQKIIRPGADDKRLVFVGRINTAIIGGLVTVLAVGLMYVKKVFNLIDIMVKVFGALGPAIMLPLLGGLILKKINSKGAVTGVIAGTISGVSLVVLNAVFLGVYGGQLAQNAALSYWLKQGWNSAAIGVNILVTLLGMVLGSRFSKTPPDEQARAHEFLERMKIPTEPLIKTGEERESPFHIVGIALILFGSIMLAVTALVLFTIPSRSAFVINLIAASVMLASGLLLNWRTRKSKAAAAAR